MQKEEIDYNETFAQIVEMTSICILLILVAIKDLEIHQLEVKTTFLNRDLEEEICMDQHKGYVLEDKECIDYKLSKIL